MAVEAECVWFKEHCVVRSRDILREEFLSIMKFLRRRSDQRLHNRREKLNLLERNLFLGTEPSDGP